MLPRLIFLHGGPGFKDYLQPFFCSLEKRFRCTFYDQVRGSRIQIEDQLKQLEQIVQSEPGPAVLIGHSWGGVLATQYASLHEDQLAGLVLISTGLKASQWKDDFRTELKQLGLEDAPPENIFLSENEIEAGKALLESTWESFSEETFDNLNHTFLGNYDLTSEFAQLKIPILNIFGQHDRRFPRKVTRSFRSYNPRIIDFDIPGAGHFPFLLEENRDKIIKRVFFIPFGLYALGLIERR